MFKLPAILFLFILAWTSASGQRLIKGRVVNGKTGEAIAGSSVFISNTSRGTVSDKDGNFELNDIPAGRYELVVSSVGYETNVYSFSSDQLPLNLRIEMQVRVRELENVTVEPSVEEGWDKWGMMFTNNFVGQTPNAAQCRIRNKEKIRFRYFRKSNRIIAYCDEPLVLENKALGYKLTYQLENFEVDFRKGISAFAGYPLFEELDRGRKEPKSKYVRARDKAYFGSMLHYMRSICSNTLAEEGFETRRMIRTPNHEKERIRNIFRSQAPAASGSSAGAVRVHVGGDGVKLNNAQPKSINTDSSDYYDRVMRQKDYVDNYSSHLLTADSLIIGQEGVYKVIYFTDYLSITYKNELEDAAYLAHFRESRRPVFQTSQIWLPQDEPVVVDPNGNYSPPQGVFAMSYWGWSEKIADMLPLDFEPRKEK